MKKNYQVPKGTVSEVTFPIGLNSFILLGIAYTFHSKTLVLTHGNIYNSLGNRDVMRAKKIKVRIINSQTS
jgi:hypothetical protein